jgi:hypothetical protein
MKLAQIAYLFIAASADSSMPSLLMQRTSRDLQNLMAGARIRASILG